MYLLYNALKPIVSATTIVNSFKKITSFVLTFANTF